MVILEKGYQFEHKILKSQICWNFLVQKSILLLSIMTVEMNMEIINYFFVILDKDHSWGEECLHLMYTQLMIGIKIGTAKKLRNKNSLKTTKKAVLKISVHTDERGNPQY